MPKFTPEESAILKNYISDPEADVFVVFPKLQGIVGPAFARYSRARGGFRETFLKEFLRAGILDQKHAQELIERILIAFGDESVGELEGAWLSFEGISNIATKEIEDRRIGGSPIEQSSRYVFYDQEDELGRFNYLRVPEIMAGPLKAEFESGMDFVFTAYCRLIEPMQSYLRALKPLEEASYDIRGDKQPVKLAELNDGKERQAFRTTYNSDIRARACDILRIMLPACTKTNVGLLGNGRYFQCLLTRLYSSNLAEMQGLAQKAHQALNTVIPVYVKRAKRDPYLIEREKELRKFCEELLSLFRPEEVNDVELLEGISLEEDVLATMLYAYAEHPMKQLRAIVSNMEAGQRQKLLELYKGNRQNRRDRPGRALEAGYPIAFDCIGDFGIYRDLQRDRMKTQIRQMLSTRLSYVIPEEFEKIGEKESLLKCYEVSAGLYEKIRVLHGREVAQYAVLFGHKIRWYQGENYREALHELELRTIPQGHPSYRRMCQKMHRLMQQRDPFLSQLFSFVDHNSYYWSRAESEAKQRVREADLLRRPA